MRVSKTGLSVTVYGGAPGEIGGNRILLEWAARRWLLDFGMRFGPTGKFFEEFVQPRGATLGLRDYLRMGLIPPLEGLYRNDLAAHDPALWARYRGHPQYRAVDGVRSEEHTSELQSRLHLVCRLLLEKKKTNRRETGRVCH